MFEHELCQSAPPVRSEDSAPRQSRYSEVEAWARSRCRRDFTRSAGILRYRPEMPGGFSGSSLARTGARQRGVELRDASPPARRPAATARIRRPSSAAHGPPGRRGRRTPHGQRAADHHVVLCGRANATSPPMAATPGCGPGCRRRRASGPSAWALFVWSWQGVSIACSDVLA